MENILNDDFIDCRKCKGKSFLITNGDTICKSCGLFLFKNSNNTINEKTKNKIIHLNNVLKNIETINQIEIDEMLDEIEKNITDDIDVGFIDSTYIADILKKKGKKSYVLNIQVYNQFLQNNLFHTNKDKKIVSTIFIGFMKYAIELNSDILNGSIPYLQILHNIYKYLDININIKPSLSRNVNENLNIIFDGFLNSLCDKYIGDKHKVDEKTILFSPSIDHYPNIMYEED
ncbi:putative viral late transcription factor 3 [Yalta virus]|nr:putative viral late transcription factor 3 [Yalta virus]